MTLTAFVARHSPRNHLGETISTPPDQTIGICNDGVLWYFRLNSEKEKEMTEEETKDFERKAKCEPLACLLLLVARTHCWLFQACVDEKAFSSRGEGDQDHAGQTPQCRGGGGGGNAACGPRPSQHTASPYSAGS